MAERGLRLRLGAFVAGSLALLAVLIVLFGRAPELFSSKAHYTLLFPEAPGIGPGTPIRKSGVRIGEVTSLDLDPESGQVRVRVRVERRYLPRTTEEATITKGLLSGDTAIDFLPRLSADGARVAAGQEYPPDAEITGAQPITARTLMTPAAGMLAAAPQSLDRLLRSFEKLERLAPKLEAALDEFGGLARDARGFIPELKKTNEKIQNLLGSDGPAPGSDTGVIPAGGATFAAAQNPDAVNLKVLIKDIQDIIRAIRPAVDDVRASVRRLEPEVAGAVKSARQTFDSVNDVLSPENRKTISEVLKNVNGVAAAVVRISTALTALLESADKTLKNVDAQVTSAGAVIGDVRAVTKPLAARSEAIVTSVTESAEQLNKAITEVRVLLQTFGKGNGAIQKLLTEPGVYQNLDDAAGSLARVLARAEKISRDLEVFADKIARRPELIGVGGALRPSSGLKDLPGTALPSYRPDWPPALPARPSAGPNWLPPADAPPPVQGYPPR